MEQLNKHPAAGNFQFAAIFSEQGDTADKIIERIITQLRCEGKKVAGFCQHTSVNACADCTSRVLNIETGLTYALSKAANRNAASSEFDSNALEQTAKTLLERLGNKPDVVTFNRFGQYESDGYGFCCVIERAIELKIPLLTVVHSRWQQSWHDFAPGHMTTLPPSYDCVLNWCHAVMVTRGSSIGHKSAQRAGSLLTL